jgi:hypothetical protein
MTSLTSSGVKKIAPLLKNKSKCIHQEKKNMPTIFRLGARAIGTCLVLLGQLINFLFSYTASYSAIGSRLAVNWQVGQLISN